MHKYEGVIERQRQSLQRQRQEILTGIRPCASETERLVALTAIDDLWSEYLAAVADLREGIHWISVGGRDPLHEFLNNVHVMFGELRNRIEEEARRTAEAKDDGFDERQRGATWTYLTTDQPFGSAGQRISAGLVRMVKSRRFWS